MKKLFAVVLVLIMALSMCACGGPAPGDSVSTFLDAYKAKDTETAQSVYAGELEDIMFLEQFGETVEGKMLAFDYKITSENVEEDKATVDVEITTYDLASVYKDVEEDFWTILIGAAFSGDSEANTMKQLGDLMSEGAAALDKKEYKATATIDLKLVDDTWVIQPFEDESFLKATLGGLIEALEEVEEGLQ